MRQLFSILLIFVGLSAFAQNFPAPGSSITGKIEGTLKDSIANTAVEYASVALYKTDNPAPVSGVVSETDGHFRLTGIAPGVYKVVISFIGYGDRTINNVETTGAKPDLDLGTIKLSTASTALNEVVVQAAPHSCRTKSTKWSITSKRT
ncbi:carboxypeptidase regulatory-like domain-containing protein [Flavobacterium sp.]|uniref:carboxypeptidase regulatory-like domain-containing protein n=1 Tax=Flavobacterium sp. TaxID=239 RepID=UPI0012057C8F|nr:carboxypeptidase regulatory-like domain-containing protein [Flavobacterium sp.]RZJ69877.1 MAG: carboxypeptidase-like regulatory domain-containing protein [Flavobacterium sp.]